MDCAGTSMGGGATAVLLATAPQGPNNQCENITFTYLLAVVDISTKLLALRRGG